jgi:preprotein translocase subunit SecD
VRAAVDQSIEIVRRRVDELGTTEPNIQRQGADRIVVQVPGLDDPERLKALIGQTAQLTFRFVDMSMPASRRSTRGRRRIPRSCTRWTIRRSPI